MDAGETIEVARIPLDELAEKLAPLLIDRLGALASKSSIDLSVDTTDKNGSVVAGRSVLANAAVDGFLYIRTCAGVPTGVPTVKTGTVAMLYDTTNNHLYVYNGGWKKVLLA